MTDIMYFGYDSDSLKLEIEFKEDIKDIFPDVILKDAYNEIKGYRQEVIIDDSKDDTYLGFILAYGWLNSSLHMQILMMDKEQHDEFHRLINVAKSLYPDCFKKDS